MKHDYKYGQKISLDVKVVSARYCRGLVDGKISMEVTFEEHNIFRPNDNEKAKFYYEPKSEITKLAFWNREGCSMTIEATIEDVWEDNTFSIKGLKVLSWVA